MKSAQYNGGMARPASAGQRGAFMAEIAWFEREEQALVDSYEHGKPVLLDFFKPG